MRLAKLTVRKSGNTVYVGRVRIARNVTQEILNPERFNSNVIDTKQRYLKVTSLC
ncbi:hypothetical protein [Pantoea sp. BAV 3049]|uniref:hypothetical protein n=1 Tax=Pantoea sp. BAV 3049 TaxID=2654188 RepID=UPI00131ADE94|nr:hypothetical protein [Pantoea sp. BAV 3049]